jgi:DNA-binding transcriptional MerR regulator
VTYDPGFVPLTREQIAERTGLSSRDITRLEEMGLLFPTSNGNGHRYYDDDDLKVTEMVATELRLGAALDDFAAYAAAMRTLVQEEFNLFYKLAGGSKPALERTRQLKETADLVHTLLRAKLTRKLMAQIERT